MIPGLLVDAVLVAAVVGLAAAGWLWTRPEPPRRLRVVPPVGWRIVDPPDPPLDWADWDDGGSAA